MRISKIVCDGCGKEIDVEPIHMFAETVDRENGDIVGNGPKYAPNKDFCDKCFEKIKDFIETMGKKSVTEEKRKPVAEEKEWSKEIFEEFKQDQQKTRKQEDTPPVPTQKEKPASTGKPTVKELILQGMDKKEIMRITECTPATVDQTKYKLKKDGLLPKELDGEEILPPVRVYDCNKVHDSCAYADKGTLCGYINETGKMRGCPVNECTKYEKKKKGGKK